jgi:peptidoglycan/xylan/chitin deacetylase (PgdA/CDA1 family)
MKIVFSVIGKTTDDFTRVPDNNLDYSHVTWNQLNEMLDSGSVEVQNHTYNLHSTRNGRIGCMQSSGETLEEYEHVLINDIGELQDKILNFTGELPNTFTYPYGKFSKNTDKVIKMLGFKATLTCTYGINLITKDPEILFGLKRICRSHGDTMIKIIKEVKKTIR